MFDKGIVPVDEFAKKLINQGMILGTSAFVYRATAFVKNGCDIDKSNDDVLAKIPTLLFLKTTLVLMMNLKPLLKITY